MEYDTQNNLPLPLRAWRFDNLWWQTGHSKLLVCDDLCSMGKNKGKNLNNLKHIYMSKLKNSHIYQDIWVYSLFLKASLVSSGRCSLHGWKTLWKIFITLFTLTPSSYYTAWKLMRNHFSMTHTQHIYILNIYHEKLHNIHQKILWSTVSFTKCIINLCLLYSSST